MSYDLGTVRTCDFCHRDWTSDHSTPVECSARLTNTIIWFYVNVLGVRWHASYLSIQCTIQWLLEVFAPRINRIHGALSPFPHKPCFIFWSLPRG